MKQKRYEELRQMSNAELRLERDLAWFQYMEAKYGPWMKAQREGWAPILRAVERSNENKAALVLKSGAFVRGIITVEFWAEDRPQDALVRLDVDRRDGRPVEQYMPHPEELMAYLERLMAPDSPYHLTARWEPV